MAVLKNGQSITEANVTPGPIPVIAGGRGTIPYYHNEANAPGQVVTVSKSGALSGYVWWHDAPIWASDSMVITSRDESKFLTRFLFWCLRLKQEEIYDRQQGTGQPHIYISHLEDFPIPDIPLRQQRAMLRLYETVHGQIQALQQSALKHEDSILQALASYYDKSHAPS